MNNMEGWLLNWTSWVMRNTQAEFDGITYDNGTNPDWFELMWYSWLANSDYGHKLKQEQSLTKMMKPDEKDGLYENSQNNI